MTDVHRPPTLTLRSRTGAAKPTFWPTLNPCHFTVPCFIFKTKTFSFSSKQALSNNVFGVKIGRTTTLRRLFEVINFRRSKFVCTLSPRPVFGMCAPGLATHLTTPVCPVARTQTIILQVVYSNCALDEDSAGVTIVGSRTNLGVPALTNLLPQTSLNVATRSPELTQLAVADSKERKKKFRAFSGDPAMGSCVLANDVAVERWQLL